MAVSLRRSRHLGRESLSYSGTVIATADLANKTNRPQERKIRGNNGQSDRNRLRNHELGGRGHGRRRACRHPKLQGGVQRRLPVAFTKEGERLVGQVARRQAITNPENTVFSIKRFMGRKHDEVNAEEKLVPYDVGSGKSRSSDRKASECRKGILAAGDQCDDSPKDAPNRRRLSWRKGRPGRHHCPGILQRRTTSSDKRRWENRWPRSTSNYKRAHRRRTCIWTREKI